MQSIKDMVSSICKKQTETLSYVMDEVDKEAASYSSSSRYSGYDDNYNKKKKGRGKKTCFY
jgi:hypothetical protein